MKIFKKAVLLLMIVFLFTSCASILNPRYQKVEIKTPVSDEMTINEEKPEIKAGKVLLKRDYEVKRIRLVKEGMKDINIAVRPYKLSPLYIFSWVPFGVLFFPPFMDFMPKAYDYDRVIEITDTFCVIPKRQEDSKYLKINKLGIDVEANNIKVRSIDYNQYIKEGISTEAKAVDDAEDVKFEQSVFSGFMNDLLKERGYIDTTKKALKTSFLNDMYIDASIKGYTVNIIGSKHSSSYLRSTDIMFLELIIDWKLLDYYKTPVFEYTTESKSGHFHEPTKKFADLFNPSFEDALDRGFIEFVSKSKVQELLNDRSDIETELAYDDYIIKKPKNTVATLSESVNASVTVKTADSHGSGFFISEDGYIITNYHVISDTSKKYTVVLYDGTEFENAEIVRHSKIHDLALLKIDTSGLIAFSLSEGENNKVPLASDIFAVGTPTAEDLNQTISKGIVSGYRTKGETNLIQVDASINSGNSGGALINADAVVVGVVASKLFGFSIEGVAFGIPSYLIFEKLKIKYE